jgi:hypothetical protein
LIYEDRATRPDGFYVLGRMTARIEERPRAGEPLLVSAWRVSHEGRKLLSASALQSPAGDIVGVARSTWISI